MIQSLLPPIETPNLQLNTEQIALGKKNCLSNFYALGKGEKATLKQVGEAGKQSHQNPIPQSCDPQLRENSKLRALKTNGAHIHDIHNAITI